MIETYPCRYCNQNKPAEAFGTTLIGKQFKTCKSCRQNAHRQQYQTYYYELVRKERRKSQHYKTYQAEYRKNHHEALQQYQQEYRQKHKPYQTQILQPETPRQSPEKEIKGGKILVCF
jgi:hypothetical protein